MVYRDLGCLSLIKHALDLTNFFIGCRNTAYKIGKLRHLILKKKQQKVIYINKLT